MKQSKGVNVRRIKKSRSVPEQISAIKKGDSAALDKLIHDIMENSIKYLDYPATYDGVREWLLEEFFYIEPSVKKKLRGIDHKPVCPEAETVAR